MNTGILLAILINVFAAALNFTFASISYANKQFAFMPINLACGLLSTAMVLYLVINL